MRGIQNLRHSLDGDYAGSVGRRLQSTESRLRESSKWLNARLQDPVLAALDKRLSGSDRFDRIGDVPKMFWLLVNLAGAIGYSFGRMS
jgi:hypothetical protein